LKSCAATAEKKMAKSSTICSVCKGPLPAKAERCPRCGVAVGNPFEKVSDVIDKYDEGCEPRTYKEDEDES